MFVFFFSDFHNLEVTNECPLPLNVTVKAPPPFTVKQTQFTLNPKESISTAVSFAPVLSADMVTCSTLSDNLIFSFDSHPLRAQLSLIGHLCFPNLTLSESRVDFGVVPCDTEKRAVFSITNTRSPTFFVS